MITQIFNPTAELAILRGTQTNEENAKIETQPVTIETKISKFSTEFKYLHVFFIFHSLSHYVLFHLKDNFLFHQFS